MRPLKVRVELESSHMREYGVCRVAGQRLGPSNVPPGGITCGVQTEAKTASPTLTTPGGLGCGVPSNEDYDSFSNHCEERTNGSHCPLPLVRLGQPSGKGHRQWALTKQKVCGTVRGGGGEPRGHETVPGEGGAYWSLCEFLCVPMGRARSGLPQEPLWGRLGPEI